MATTPTKPNVPSKFQTEVAGMISGFTNDLPTTVKNLTIAGGSMTVAAILSQLNAIMTTINTVATTKTAFTEAVAARKAALPADKAFIAQLVMAVKLLFGTSASQLAAFGITPPKAKAKPTIKALAIAKAKSAATRALRGTKGKKQKAAITLQGQSTLQVLGPDGQPVDPADAGSSSGSAPATPAAPAAAAPVTPAPTPPAAH